jgi:hypothetical protein
MLAGADQRRQAEIFKVLKGARLPAASLSNSFQQTHSS